MPKTFKPRLREFKTISAEAAKSALAVADKIAARTGQDPLKPHQRRELMAQSVVQG